MPRSAHARLALALLCAAVSAVAAHADDAATTTPPKPWSATAKLGYVQTGGNTEVLTLLAGDNLKWTSGRWVVKQDGEAVYGRDHGIENAGRYAVALRTDYTITDRLSPYALVSWRRNTFGGINRQYDEGAGLVFHAIVPQPQQLDIEGGAGATQREDVTKRQDNFANARVAGLYKYTFLEKSSLTLGTAWMVNLKHTADNELDSRASVAAPLAAGISLTLGYDSIYRNQPLPGFKKTDWTVNAGVQFTY